MDMGFELYNLAGTSPRLAGTDPRDRVRGVGMVRRQRLGDLPPSLNSVASDRLRQGNKEGWKALNWVLEIRIQKGA